MTRATTERNPWVGQRQRTVGLSVMVFPMTIDLLAGAVTPRVRAPAPDSATTADERR